MRCRLFVLGLGAGLTLSGPILAATVRVPPGANIQAYVDANPAGTSYQLSAGRYRGQTVVPKSNDTFLGARDFATILDGLGGRSEHHAFQPERGTDNVTIRGLVIQGYIDSPNPDLETGVFGSRGRAMTGWRIDSNEIRFNLGAGLVTANGMTILANRIHDNAFEGVKGYVGTHNVTIAGNDIYNNNEARRSPYGATGFASAFKAVHVTNYSFLNNRIHDNYGFGIWLDTDWTGIVVDGNEIYRQLAVGGPSVGVYMEAGLAGGNATDNRISNNFIHDNDIGLDIATASDLDVYGNAFQANRVATIRSFEEKRGAGGNGVERRQQHVHIHDNWLAYSSGVVSQFDSEARSRWYDGDNIYVHNTYYIGCEIGDFAYQGGAYGWHNGTLLSYRAWRSLPSNPDSTSTFKCGRTTLPAPIAVLGKSSP